MSGQLVLSRPGPRLRAFKVRTELSESAGRHLAQSENIREDIPVLHTGQRGWIPLIPENFEDTAFTRMRRFVIVQLLEYGDRGLHEVPNMPRGNGKALVPRTRIQLGALQCFGDYPVISSVRIGQPALTDNEIVGRNRLQSFLLTLFGSFGLEQSVAVMKALGVDESPAAFIGDTTKREAMIFEIVKGMSQCGTSEMFSAGIPSLEAIWRQCRRVDSDETSTLHKFGERKGSFFYIIIYRTPNHSSREYAAYVGRTSNLTRRWQTHDREVRRFHHQPVHYKIAKKFTAKGAEYFMFPIFFLPESTRNYHLTCAWLEMGMICLFETFNPHMLAFESFEDTKPQHTSGSTAALESRDEEIHADAVRDIYRKVSSSPLANRLLTVTRRVKSQPAFQSFQLQQQLEGCNWALPILENIHFETNVWIQTAVLGKDGNPLKFIFTTSPRRVNGDRRVQLFHSKPGHNPAHFRPTLSKEQFPEIQPGSLVNVVLEVMAHDKPHPYPYIDVPVVGPIDCWSQASRLAIRIEFQDQEGNWATKWLLQTSPFYPLKSYIKDAVDWEAAGEITQHMDISWLHCMKILSGLFCWEWAEDSILTSNLLRPYTCVVRQWQMDFVHQRIILRSPEKQIKPVPRLLSCDDTTDRIEEIFGYEVNIGLFPGKELVWKNGTRMSRERYDLCQILFVPNERLPTVTKGCSDRIWVDLFAGEQRVLQCKFCKYMRRYCSFTRDMTAPRFHRLFYHRRQFPALQAIPAPQNALLFLEILDSMEDAVEDGAV